MLALPYNYQLAIGFNDLHYIMVLNLYNIGQYLPI